jgi:hypothetical protein
MPAIALQVFLTGSAHGQSTFDLSVKSRVDTHIYSNNDDCNQPSRSEIVVCGRRLDEGKYRIPTELRDADRGVSTNDVQVRLGPSYICNNSGNIPCSKAAIPIFSIKNGKTQIGPIKPH